MLKLLSRNKIKLWILVLFSFGLVHFPLPLKAESISWETSNHESLDFSENGRPKRTAGGASRGECRVQPSSSDNSYTPLTALIPDNSVALTASASPTLWFYVPYSLSSKHSVELIVKDNRDNFIYKNKFPATEIASGIISLSLPSTVTLETNKNYSWHFLIYCDTSRPDRFVYVNGYVRRVEISALKSQLPRDHQQEELNLYIKEKIWYDALTNVAKSLQKEPQNQKFRTNWTTFLKSVGLDDLIDKSFPNKL